MLMEVHDCVHHGQHSEHEDRCTVHFSPRSTAKMVPFSWHEHVSPYLIPSILVFRGWACEGYFYVHQRQCTAMPESWQHASTSVHVEARQTEENGCVEIVALHLCHPLALHFSRSWAGFSNCYCSGGLLADHEAG